MKRNLVALGVLVFAFLSVMMLNVFVDLAEGHISEFALPRVRVFLCAGLFLWSLIYYVMNETHWKIAFGIVQLLGAFISNWHQLGRIVDPAQPSAAYDRIAFLAAGIALMAHGIKDVMEGLEKLHPKASAAAK